MNRKLSLRLSLGEEIGNTITHGVGALGMLILLPISAVYTFNRHGAILTAGVSIFMISLFLMFLSSTLYHAMLYDTKHKEIFRVIDHAMIFVAISGSYTPVILAFLPNHWGIVMIIIQWGLTLFGIFYKVFAKRIHEKFSLVLYLVMGWMVIFILPTIIQHSTLIFGILMLCGGITYSIGAWIYSIKKPYFHMTWHLFILVASVLQYIAIVFFMT